MRIARVRGFEEIPSKTKHTLIAGISGYGKGMEGEWYIPKFLERGFKVLDLNSQSRGEGMYYGIKNDDTNMDKRRDFLSQGHFKSRAYPNRIVMFLGQRLVDLKVLPKNVDVVVFREEWLSNEDLKNLIAINESQESYMESFFEMHGEKKIPLLYFIDFLRAATKDKHSKEWKAMSNWGLNHHATISALKKRATRIWRSGIFHNSKADIPTHFKYLDIEKELKETGSITSFSTYLCNDDFIRDVCVYVLLKRFITMMEKRQIKVPLLAYFREGGDFFVRAFKTPYVERIQEMIGQILRKGRSIGGSEIVMVLDTQYPSDLPNHIFHGFNKVIAFNLPTSESKLLLTKCEIPIIYLHRLSSAKVGMFMYVAGGQFRYPLLALPTLHKKSDPSFDVFPYLIGRFGAADYSKSKFISISLLPSEDKGEFVIDSTYYGGNSEST